jgi:hypothetical protein
MSRYVDKKALALAFIAFSFLESLAAQTISTHFRPFPYLSHRNILLDARRRQVAPSAVYANFVVGAAQDEKMSTVTVR